MNIHIYLSLQKFTCDFFLAAHLPLSLGKLFSKSGVPMGESCAFPFSLPNFT